MVKPHETIPACPFPDGRNDVTIPLKNGRTGQLRRWSTSVNGLFPGCMANLLRDIDNENFKYDDPGVGDTSAGICGNCPYAVRLDSN